MTNDIKCPKCGSNTILRTSNKGPNVGQLFHVCTRYPECKGKVSVMNDEAKSLDGQKELIAIEKTLLVDEYNGIFKRTEDGSTRLWQATAFLVGGVVAAAGLIIASQNHGMESFIQTLILGIVIIIVLYLFHRLFLSRFYWRIDTLYERLDSLEGQLDFLTNRYIRTLDAIDALARNGEINMEVLERAPEVLLGRGKIDKADNELQLIVKRVQETSKKLSPTDIDYLNNLLKKCKYHRGAERDYINLLVYAGIAIWFGLIITELIFWLI